MKLSLYHRQHFNALHILYKYTAGYCVVVAREQLSSARWFTSCSREQSMMGNQPNSLPAEGILLIYNSSSAALVSSQQSLSQFIFAPPWM